MHTNVNNCTVLIKYQKVFSNVLVSKFIIGKIINWSTSTNSLFLSRRKPLKFFFLYESPHIFTRPQSLTTLWATSCLYFVVQQTAIMLLQPWTSSAYGHDNSLLGRYARYSKALHYDICWYTLINFKANQS